MQSAFKDWMIHEECSSHHVSQFAAFFIVARAERSIVKSCFNDYYNSFGSPLVVNKCNVCVFVLCNLTTTHHHSLTRAPMHRYMKIRRSKELRVVVKRRVLEFVNDPSAGSPTETLLRLLLPLNG